MPVTQRLGDGEAKLVDGLDELSQLFWFGLFGIKSGYISNQKCFWCCGLKDVEGFVLMYAIGHES